MQKFADLGKDLLQENNWLLELGATILFFYKQDPDWDRALERACAFKKVAPTDEASKAALTLAKRVLEPLAA